MTRSTQCQLLVCCVAALAALLATSSLAQDLSPRARCFSFAKSGDFSRAIKACDVAIELDTSNAELYSNRGTAYLMTRRLDNAVDDFNLAIRLAPGNALHFFNRAIAYEGRRDLQRALADYDSAIALKPDFAPAYYNRAQNLKELGLIDRAIADFRRASELSPTLRSAIEAQLRTLEGKH